MTLNERPPPHILGRNRNPICSFTSLERVFLILFCEWKRRFDEQAGAMPFLGIAPCPLFCPHICGLELFSIVRIRAPSICAVSFYLVLLEFGFKGRHLPVGFHISVRTTVLESEFMFHQPPTGFHFSVCTTTRCP